MYNMQLYWSFISCWCVRGYNQKAALEIVYGCKICKKYVKEKIFVKLEYIADDKAVDNNGFHNLIVSELLYLPSWICFSHLCDGANFTL